jgi:hypothetical protein
VAGEQFASFPEHVQAFVLKERVRLEEAEEEAEYRLALQREEDSLEAIEAGEEFDWETEVEPTNDDRYWALSAEEEQAAVDVAAANAEPVVADDDAEEEEGYDFAEEEGYE